MKSNVKILGECKREIEIDVEADEALKEFNNIVSQYSSSAKIPGFRPGKAPAAIIKQRFYPELKESLINSLVPKALASELKVHNLKPLGMPALSDLHFEEGKPLQLKAQFEVMPEFKLPEYKKIKVKKKIFSVTDKEIDQSLEELRQRSAEYVPVEGRGVVDGDYVVSEVKGKDLNTKRMLPAEKGLILAGQPDNEEILNKNLLGLKPGEEKIFVYNYDKGHLNKKLAGKKIEYNLKVLSVKVKKLPEINDDFAKDFGELEGLKELKENIKKKIISAKEKAAKEETGGEILENISDGLNIELPQILVDEEYTALFRRLLSSPSRKDLKKEDLEQLETETKKKAEQNLKERLILMKIAEKEGIDVSDEEIHEELKEIAKVNNIPLAKVVESLNREEKKEGLRKNLQFKKIVDFLVEQAIIE